MRANLTVVSPAGNAGNRVARPKESPRWAGSRDPIAAMLAPKLGLSPLYVEKLIRLAPKLIAMVVLELQASGNERRIDALLRPIMAARAGRTPVRLCETDRVRADEADAREEVLQGQYDRNHTPENRRAWARALREEARMDLMLADALDAEEQRV